MRRKKIGVLMGGLSAEREVSLKTGEAIFSTLMERGHDAYRIFVDRDVDLVLRQARIEVAVLALHGRYGEDGCVQGLLEVLGIPYTGSDVMSSALAMNKVKAKEIFRLRNLPTAPYYTLTRDQIAGPGSLADGHGSFGFPVVVKPACEGSSIGVTIARAEDELEAAVEEALRWGDEVLIERFVEGKEICVGILNDRPLGAIEVVPAGGGFYDFTAKYSSRKTEYHFPARLSPERYRGVLETALSAHRALGCSGATRVDLIVSEKGNEAILEVNTLPGMTPTSLLPKIAHGAGLSFGDLCEEILASAHLSAGGLKRHDRRFIQTSFVGHERRQSNASDPH